MDDPALSTGYLFPLLFSVSVVGIATIIFLVRSRNSAERAEDYFVQPPLQCSPGWKGEELRQPDTKISGSTAVQCYCPASGQLLGLINPSTSDSIDRIIARAKAAQHAWSSTTFAQRRQVLRSLLKYIIKHQEDIITAACLDSGKTRVDALLGEILVTVEKLKWTLDHGEQSLRTESRPTNLLMMYKSNSVRYEPLGVVAACVSWNYPFHNLVGPMISALFTGNAIVVKNSENTAWSSVYFTALVRAALAVCGHDKDVVHSVTCWPDVANHLTSHPDISHLTFIGSRPVAHTVCTSAAKSLTPVVVELGGKDPMLVLDDPTGKATSTAEMNRITSILMRGVFQAAGQNCIGIERVVAMPQSYSRLVSLLGPKVAALRVGNGLAEEVDVGAVISPNSFVRLEKLVEDAVSRGARLLQGGKRLIHPKYPSGHYFQPTLLVDVTSNMAIAQEELFAPVAIMMRARSVDDAISIANSTLFGLGSSVFGPTNSRAARHNLDTCVKQIRAGMVAVNDFAAFYAVQLPFGGVRGSGHGRFAGAEGLRGLCNIKSVCEDRVPSLVRTTIPKELDYPISKRAAAVGRGVIDFGYAESVIDKINGIRNIIGI